MSSDIRNSNSNLRTSMPVNILDDDDPNKLSATNVLTTSSARPTIDSAIQSATSTATAIGVESTTAAKMRTPVSMDDDVSEVGKPTSTSPTAIRPPSTGLVAPATPLAGASPSAKTIQGASSFAHALEDVQYKGDDSDQMTAAFMKLDSSNLSTNDQMESLENQAMHYLRVAAQNILDGLASQDPNALLNQADQMEQQGLAMLGEGSGADGDDAVAVGQSDLAQVNQQQAWTTLYNDASDYITKAANLNVQAQAAKQAGDMSTYNTLYQQATDDSDKAHTILDSAGILVSNSDAYALGTLALKMQKEGNTGNVMTEFLNEHPEKAQSMLPEDVYNQVKGQGGQAIVNAIMTQQASLMADSDEAGGVALATASNAASPEGMAALMAENPQLANNPMAGAAAGVLAQAWDLKMQAYEIQETQLDAQNAVDEGKTEQGQLGVQERNQQGNAYDLRLLFNLTSGQRPDQQQRATARQRGIEVGTGRGAPGA